MQIENQSGQNLIDKIARNTGIVIVGKVARGLIEMAIVILLARYLGVNNFGIYSFVFAYLGFFGMITDFGIESILVREISRDRSRADKLTGDVIAMKIVLSLLAIILAAVVISILGYSLDTRLLVYVASLRFLVSFRTVYVEIFRVDLKMFYPALVEILSGILKIMLFITLILLKVSLIGFIIASIIVNFFGFILIRSFSRRIIKPKLKADFNSWMYFLKESWPLALTTVFIAISMRIDQIMLFHMRGKEAVGYYSAAVTLAEAFNIIIASFMIPVFPLMSKYFKISTRTFISLYRLSYKYMFMLIIPIAIGVTVLSKQIILLIYSNRFLNASSALSILIYSEVFIYFAMIQNYILISTGKQKLNLAFIGSASVMNIILNLFLIPKYGILGASFATVVSYAWVCTLSLLLPSTYSYSLAGWAVMPKPIVASLVMAIYLYYTKNNLVISISGGILLFFSIMLLINGIQKQDIDIARQLLWRQNT